MTGAAVAGAAAAAGGEVSAEGKIAAAGGAAGGASGGSVGAAGASSCAAGGSSSTRIIGNRTCETRSSTDSDWTSSVLHCMQSHPLPSVRLLVNSYLKPHVYVHVQAHDVAATTMARIGQAWVAIR